MQETQEMWVQSLSREDPLEEEMATLLQYSCLENPMDRGAWWATVHRVSKLLLAQASCLTFFKAVRRKGFQRVFPSLLGLYRFQLEMCLPAQQHPGAASPETITSLYFCPVSSFPKNTSHTGLRTHPSRIWSYSLPGWLLLSFHEPDLFLENGSGLRVRALSGQPFRRLKGVGAAPWCCVYHVWLWNFSHSRLRERIHAACCYIYVTNAGTCKHVSKGTYILLLWEVKHFGFFFLRLACVRATFTLCFTQLYIA